MDKVFHCRIVWIDNLRLFAILCVILYHSSQLVENKVYFGWIIESFNMALFFSAEFNLQMQQNSD